MALETVTADKVNQFGIRFGDIQYNYSPKFNGAKLNQGETAQTEVYTSPKGAKYINKVLKVNSSGDEQAEVTPVQDSPAPEMTYPKKKFVSKTTPNDDAKWDKVNRGKVKSLFIEALLSNPNMVGSVKDMEGLASEELQTLLNKLVESVF